MAGVNQGRTSNQSKTLFHWLTKGNSLKNITGLRLCNLPELLVFGGIQYPSLLQEAQTNLKKLKDSQKHGPRAYLMVVSGCAICQNYLFSGESNTLPFFRRLKQIWKTERLTAARPTCVPDGRRVATYVCVNLACTSSIILQSRNTADAHPRIIRSPMWRMP